MTSEEKYVTIWRKDEAGAWKVVADIFNSNAPTAPAGDVPPPPPPPTPAGSGS
jgi:hypothetical protein